MKLKTSIGILLCLFAVILATSVWGDTASCTFNSPAATTINGTNTFNVTVVYTGINSGGNVTNVTFSTSANSKFCQNGGVNSTYYTCSYDTASLTEVASTTLTAGIYMNSSATTGTAFATCTRTIGVDNTAPTCTRTSTNIESGLRSGSLLSFDVTASDTSTLTYSTVLTLFNSDTTTKTGASNSFIGTETNSVGESTLVSTVTDAVGKTATCPTVTVGIVSKDSTTAVSQSSDVTTEKTNKNGIMLMVLVVVIVIVIGLTMMMSMKSSKRRRR